MEHNNQNGVNLAVGKVAMADLDRALLVFLRWRYIFWDICWNIAGLIIFSYFCQISTELFLTLI